MFVDSMHRHMKWEFAESNVSSYFLDVLKKSQKAIQNIHQTNYPRFLFFDALQRHVNETTCTMKNQNSVFGSHTHIHNCCAEKLSANKHNKKFENQDVEPIHYRWHTNKDTSETNVTNNFSGHDDAFFNKQKSTESVCLTDVSYTNSTLKCHPYSPECMNLWDVCRLQNAPLLFSDWRNMNLTERHRMLKNLMNTLKAAGHNKRLKKLVIQQLSSIPEISLYFPRLASVLNTDNLWVDSSLFSHARNKNISLTATSLVPCSFDASQIPPPPPPSHVSIPQSNKFVVLPNGRVVEGDGSLRTPKLYHPSWLWKASKKNSLSFDDPRRYIQGEVLKSSEVNTMFYMSPTEQTRMRMERLITTKFNGREEIFYRMIDRFFQSAMSRVSSKNDDLVSGRVTLYKFPRNGFSSMVTTGAKGSKVNYAMICGMLSQQSLEGKRVPVMVSGKTLPSFARFDFGARAGGLITDRFLTGLRPQEYFFHCMSGREGLVDTAVKTAKSGYLQRCVVKGLEGVNVQYDGTVRDSDGSVIQFIYGDDGIDVSKSPYFESIDDVLRNPVVTRAKHHVHEIHKNPYVGNSLRKAKEYLLKQENWKKNMETCNSSTLEIDRSKNADGAGDGVKKINIEGVGEVDVADPLTSVYPPTGHVGSVSDLYIDKIKEYLEKKLKLFTTPGCLSRKEMETVLLLKYHDTLACPGEAVGCLAAQSMGEPATQMTLNTFHLAGHGAANVTLGIPRLREILQTAGRSATPFLYVPLKGKTVDDICDNAQIVMRGFRKIRLTDVIHAVGVEANVCYQPKNCKGGCPDYHDHPFFSKPPLGRENEFRKYWQYEIAIQFENLDHFCAAVPKYTPKQIIQFVGNKVLREVLRQALKILVLSTAKNSELDLHEGQDELQLFFQHFVVGEGAMTNKSKAEKLKETKLVAGTAALFGPTRGIKVIDDGTEGGDYLAKNMLKSSREKVDYNDNDEPDKYEIVEQEVNDHADDAGEDDTESDSENTDSAEEEYSDSELGDDVEARSDTEKEDDDAYEKKDKENNDSDDAGDIGKESSDDEAGVDVASSSGRKGKPKVTLTSTSKYSAKYEFDDESKTYKTEVLPEVKVTPLESEAMWKDNFAEFCIKSLPFYLAQFLHGVKVCDKSWTMVVKFGWPAAKCPHRLEFLDMLVNLIKKFTLQDTAGLANPRIVGGDNCQTGAKYELHCEGSNFGWIHNLKDYCVDHNRIQSNDIKAVLEFYGVEAARSCIIKELNKVFAVYGIKVDYRHICLIADFMTRSGGFKPFNRQGIASHNSPFLQMSFETSMKFLTDACERGAFDDLRTPAGALVTGKPCNVGTGMFQVMSQLGFKASKAHEFLESSDCRGIGINRKKHKNNASLTFEKVLATDREHKQLMPKKLKFEFC